MIKNDSQDNIKNNQQNYNIQDQTKDKISIGPNSNIKILNKVDESIHYLCPKCFKFPFIKFYKDKKNIRITCSCFNNKKILIKDFLNKTNNYILIESNLSNLDIIELDGVGLFCQNHNQKYIGFDKRDYLNNCKDSLNENSINYKDIEIDNEKINKLLKYINLNSDNYINNLKPNEEISNKN